MMIVLLVLVDIIFLDYEVVCICFYYWVIEMEVMMNGFDYSGKMVFVMGGIKGIGWCIVEWFFVVGVCVFVCGCSVFDMLLLVNGCMVVFVVVDLCDIE